MAGQVVRIGLEKEFSAMENKKPTKKIGKMDVARTRGLVKTGVKSGYFKVEIQGVYGKVAV
jgi:hypothetical protein